MGTSVTSTRRPAGRDLARSPKFRLGYTWDEIKEKVEKGEWQLHQYPLGFVFTEIKKCPEEKVCVVHFLGGRQFDSWKEKLVSDLEAFGIEHGCDALEAGCRFGLFKKLKPLGWKAWHLIVRKELR